MTKKIRQYLAIFGNMKIPPKYTITLEMLEILGKIEAIRQYLLTLNIPPNVNQKIQRISLLKSSLYSAKIEGNPLDLENYKRSPDKIKKLEIDNIIDTTNFISKLKIKKINLSLIKTLHKITMNSIHYQAGSFRREMSAIFNQSGVAIYVCPPPSQITQLINQLINYINSDKEKFPLIKAFITHLLFEKIHPFLDGNGRIGRLLIYSVCQIKNYQFKPTVSFEESLDKNKNDYYYYLDIGLKNTNDYLFFMLQTFFEQAEKLKKEIEKEVNAKTQINLPPRQEEIYQIIKDHQIISLDFIKRRFLKVPSRTLRYDLKKICDRGLVIKIGQTKGSYYKIIP
ncbi:hypothetical protein COW98_00280 [Candidatus Roizmanbacteria bacterium CG22_combo_CG10-13_8_21_14_all_35_9]|uniref:Fido domain-containing protein n=4 Tax=Candidatus Roizmaniibacteriota TaxID=1752723 RepID=A0A2H0BZK4_9BACT|nr:MAG: hypothetical protein COX47_02545 [Candidatus Roizmanbacteria bacterium CG23_combo_of_CG06-09_8_20_14_all_35_49]PIP63133.1 MAG: hypothetical protein COW98_00280 [Candidatus Roizmanbacteria bacterium CG22_combo_CG10-13_8_21_14_all_35_9]PJC82470.1 MAG: hypothetical protein CO006_03480 [Candidatus Roizmanbacteria bacterium CG_4_8_14_3_um_filter_35_14]